MKCTKTAHWPLCRPASYLLTVLIFLHQLPSLFLSRSLFCLKSFLSPFTRLYTLLAIFASLDAYHVTLLLKRTIVYSSRPSSTCFIVHTSCTEELERFVYASYTEELERFVHCKLSGTRRSYDQPINVDYRLVWGSLRLAPISLLIVQQK